MYETHDQQDRQYPPHHQQHHHQPHSQHSHHAQQPPPAPHSHYHPDQSLGHHYSTMNGSQHSLTRNSSSSSLSNMPQMMHPSSQAPPPPQSSLAALPGPSQLASTKGKSEGRTYELIVYQQPVRARMCGFGDKDRRPITPPPCARLIVRDADTGKEVDINEIDTSFFVLTVDLWSADGQREVNLVRHSATSPSISAAVSSSYPPPPPTPPPHSHSPYPPPSHQQGMYSNSQYQNSSYPPYNPGPPQQQGYYGQQQNYGYPSLPPPVPQSQSGQPGPAQSQALAAPQQQPPSGMFTRNLIGSLSASAFKLTDPDNKIGVWFILQDLSVRTEGTFRLKMNFVNVATNGRLHTNNTPVPVLASVFSHQFQVYSAKKFPGVIESTELSKCFATQGIKIPIRKDGPKALSRGQDDYDDE